MKVGDLVELTTPTATVTPCGIMPRVRTVRVAGIFALGLFEFDSAYGFVSLELAKRLLAKDHPDLIQLRVNDIYSANAIARSIENELGDKYLADDWSRMNQSLFSALWLEKMAISITIGLIVMVGALNIISSLILLVRQKSRDIAILKTMGTSSRRVMGIFMMQGLVIGVVGTTIGALERAGVVLGARSLQLIQIPMDVYQVSHVPFVVLPWDLLTVVVATILICFLATIYPSRQASTLDPVQALRVRIASWRSSRSAVSISLTRLALQRLHVLRDLELSVGKVRWWPSSARQAWGRARCFTFSVDSIAQMRGRFASPIPTCGR